MRALIVEDEHKIAQAIGKGLEQENYTVDLAFEGISGYDLASTEHYDVIILDRLLPEIDGIEITRKLRRSNIHTPILMLTAKAQVDEKVEGLNAGVDDYLTKPFAFSELLARIRALIRRPQEFKDQILKIADLSLNLQTFEVRRGKKTLKLSAKEFSLLAYLLRNQNKILSKEQIINHVWSYEDNVLPNTVEVWILNLRKKIDKAYPDSSPLIHTVRGFGYKIAKGIGQSA